MISESLHNRIRTSVAWLQRFVDRLWYPPLVALLAAVDNFLIFVPTDGILISSSMLKPKRWLILAFGVAFGSTLGAIALAALVEYQGLPWILEFFPNIAQSKTWIWTEKFFQDFGLYLVFAIAMTPLVQQPAVILASLAHTPLAKLAAVIFAGRLFKYLVMAYVSSHAPGLLKKMWGLKGEMADVGVKIN